MAGIAIIFFTSVSALRADSLRAYAPSQHLYSTYADETSGSEMSNKNGNSWIENDGLYKYGASTNATRYSKRREGSKRTTEDEIGMLLY
ncbi:unnamed protein product, partial [Iphiclides podalirius]